MPEKRIQCWVQRFKQRKNLQIQWHDPDTGQRLTRSAKTDNWDEPEARKADLEYELNHMIHVAAPKMTWERFRQLYETEYLVGRRRNSGKIAKRVFDLFEEICHPKLLSSINERTLSAYAAGLRKRPGKKPGSDYMASSIKTNFGVLRAALRWALYQKILPSCPNFPTIKVPRKYPMPVPAESFEKLMAVAPDQETRAFLLLGWCAGLRTGESRDLEWERTDKAPWVDLEAKRIWFPGEVVKGGRDQAASLHDDRLFDALASLPRNGPRVFQINWPGYVFKELAKKAGVRMTYKDLRKGFACRCAKRFPPQIVQKLMRHSDIRITMAFYANVDDAVDDAMLALSNAERNTLPASTSAETADNSLSPCPA